MSVHRVLTWLCERPQRDFTLGWVLRLAGVRQHRLATKAARTRPRRAAGHRLIFLGAVAAFIYYRGLPLGSLGEVNSFTDGLVLVAIVKVVAIVAGWAVQFSLRIINYIVGGFERLAPRRPLIRTIRPRMMAAQVRSRQ